MVALQVHNRRVAALGVLGAFPLSGRVGRIPGTRELVIARSPYIAVYKPDAR